MESDFAARIEAAFHMTTTTELPNAGPYVIGATGGSGTRVFARIVRAAGMFTGENLNESEDALDFALFLDRWINDYGRRNDASPALEEKMRAHLSEVLDKHCAHLARNRAPLRWGWKEPRSIYLLPFFHRQFPQMKFLHVVRDGRDMAYSSNQNQLRRHGRSWLGWRERLRPRPLRAVMLWSRVNMAAADYGERELGARYMRMRFEDLCAVREESVRRVLDFFDLEGDASRIALNEVKPPASIGRWRMRPSREVAEAQRIAHEALRRFEYMS